MACSIKLIELKKYIHNNNLVIDENIYNYDMIICSIPKIKRYCKRHNLKLVIKENKKRNINSLKDIEIAINIQNRYEQISFIYDKVCDYLDYEFIRNNKCIFIKDKCISDRNKNYDKNCGCCRSKSGELCQYLKDGRCTIRNMGCKFFVCPTLKKEGINYKISYFPLLKYFFSFRQKLVLRYTIFIPKEEVIERVIKYRW